MMTMTQQRRAAHFTVLFLEQEIKDIKASIHNAYGNSRTLLETRLKELEKELKTFREINDRLNV